MNSQIAANHRNAKNSSFDRFLTEFIRSIKNSYARHNTSLCDSSVYRGHKALSRTCTDKQVLAHTNTLVYALTSKWLASWLDEK